ncbi:MAG: hypothetical protein Q7V14_03140 [Coriobacteriia bacterium]|nr:hypothetical protein [Coriobacteriia bacterium]
MMLRVMVLEWVVLEWVLEWGSQPQRHLEVGGSGHRLGSADLLSADESRREI